MISLSLSLYIYIYIWVKLSGKNIMQKMVIQFLSLSLPEKRRKSSHIMLWNRPQMRDFRRFSGHFLSWLWASETKSYKRPKLKHDLISISHFMIFFVRCLYICQKSISVNQYFKKWKFVLYCIVHSDTTMHFSIPIITFPDSHIKAWSREATLGFLYLTVFKQ